MHEEYYSWYSRRLNKDVSLLVFGHAGAKVLVFPTRDGNFLEYQHLRIPEVLRMKIEAGHLQLYCLDYSASETFYCWWAHPAGRVYRHWQFEEYILHEVFPLMRQKNSHECVIAHGCSFGAFLAANIAFRHPHLFRKLVCFSGRYDLTINIECFRDLLDGYYDENVYFHMPTHFLPNLTCNDRLHAMRQIDMVFVVGQEDPFKGNNMYLGNILAGKGIDHHLHFWDHRAHRGYYWRRMARLYI